MTTDRQREQVGRPFSADLSAYVQPVAAPHHHSPQRVFDRVVVDFRFGHSQISLHRLPLVQGVGDRFAKGCLRRPHFLEALEQLTHVLEGRSRFLASQLQQGGQAEITSLGPCLDPIQRLDRCQQLFAGHRRILSRVVDLAPNMGHAGDVRDRQLAEHRRVRTAPVSLDRVGLGSCQELGGSVL